jgi:intron-binding protein aquarius
MIDVILSLTRTSRVGYLRDIRRLTVALSRARLGLYVLGRREVFESCFELRQAFDILLQRPDKLMLVTGELWPSQRILADEEGKDVPGQTPMESVEHLGQYVYEMTKSKIQQIRAERGLEDVEIVALEEDAPTGELGNIVEEETFREEVEEGFEAEEE